MSESSFFFLYSQLQKGFKVAHRNINNTVLLK